MINSRSGITKSKFMQKSKAFAMYCKMLVEFFIIVIFILMNLHVYQQFMRMKEVIFVLRRE